MEELNDLVESIDTELQDQPRRGRRRRQVAEEASYAPPTLREALMSEHTIILAPREIAEKPNQLDAAKRAALGGEPLELCVAPVVGQARPDRFRRGDLLVVAVPNPNSPGNLESYKLVGPIEIDRYWNQAAEGGYGAVEPSTFFQAVAKAAHPLYCARREENHTFELRLA